MQHEASRPRLDSILRLVLAAVLFWCLAIPSGPPAVEASLGSASDIAQGAERGRDPLGIVRSLTRPRVWVLLDTSTSMREALGGGTRFSAAREVIQRVARTLESDDGEPLVHWRLAAFQRFRSTEDGGTSREDICKDPTEGAGLPFGSPPGPPRSPVRCGGAEVLFEPTGCDLLEERRALIRSLSREPNTNRTPNGIALYQLAAHIAENSLDDLQPGQKNIIVLITDGIDTCECVFHPWLDFNEGPPGSGNAREVWLRTGAASPEPIRYPGPSRDGFATFNAGLKAKAAHRAMNGGDPDAGLGEIHVVGVAMSDAKTRGYTNHLAWMASGLRTSAIHVDRPDELREALAEVIAETTLPGGEARLAAPRLGTVKELVADSPSPDFPGSDPRIARDALVADPGDPQQLEKVLQLRWSYADNVLIVTGAEMTRLRGHLRAFPTPRGGGEDLPESPIWDAGLRLARRDPADRVVLFNRPGSTRLRAFRTGEVTAADLGVGAGYLGEWDGTGARTAADAAEIVVRLVRGEELSLHPDTGTMYDPAGRLHFGGGRGTWKLREGLASPAVVTNPPLHPERVSRNRDRYRRFFEQHVNRRTMLYLPTSGGLLHAFAGDSGEEIFAYIPDDVLGPAPGERAPGRAFLRELVLAALPERSGLRRGLWNRFALAGSPVVRDAFFPEDEQWRTVLSFGRFVGGRFLTALDISAVGDGWSGGHAPPRPPEAGPGLPRLLFNIGNRRTATGLEGLGETPEPLIVEVPASDGGAWLAFVPGGAGHPGEAAGESLFAFQLENGGVAARFPIPPAPSAVIEKNGAITPAAGWRPSWGSADATDLVTRIYVGDLHGQIHRLDLSDPGAWEWRVGYRLGGEHPILTPPVVFPFPDRTEPHLLIVTGGDRRVPHAPSHLVLLRDLGTRFEEVWRKPLLEGERPQGKPAVFTDAAGVQVVLATRTHEREERSCEVRETAGGESSLHAFDGSNGTALSGVLHPSRSTVSFGTGRIRGVALSTRGNLAFSVSNAAGEVLDTVIGDFEFKVREGALESVTLFVEGFRRSPFS